MVAIGVQDKLPANYIYNEIMGQNNNSLLKFNNIWDKSYKHEVSNKSNLKQSINVKINNEKRTMIISFLNNNLGTNNIIEAKTYLEDSLKMVLHLIMSQPEYQLG